MYRNFQTLPYALQTLREEEGFTHFRRVGTPSRTVYILYRMHQTYHTVVLLGFNDCLKVWQTHSYSIMDGAIPQGAVSLAWALSLMQV